MQTFLILLAAYVVADAITGIYHMVTDLGYNTPTQVGYFRNHHLRPETMTFDLQPLLAMIPLFAVAYFFWPLFFIATGIFVAAGQIPHYYTHHRRNIPKVILWLQQLHIIMDERGHNRHHWSKNYDVNYCVLSGWNNWWLNKVSSYISMR